jgi:hypothetical protein
VSPLRRLGFKAYAVYAAPARILRRGMKVGFRLNRIVTLKLLYWFLDHVQNSAADQNEGQDQTEAYSDIQSETVGH